MRVHLSDDPAADKPARIYYKRGKILSSRLNHSSDTAPNELIEFTSQVVLMSATVDVDLFSKYFKCPVIEVPERTFTVDRYFLEDTIEMMDFVPPPPRKKSKNSKKNPLAGNEMFYFLKCPLPWKQKPHSNCHILYFPGVGGARAMAGGTLYV